MHTRNKATADDVDYEVVAEVTSGMSGAQLANLVDVAALAVLREGRVEVSGERGDGGGEWRERGGWR